MASPRSERSRYFSAPAQRPELQTGDKRYALEGDAASIKVGDRVKISGSRVKKTKDQTGDQVYRVEKLRKDYGPCPVGRSVS